MSKKQMGRPKICADQEVALERYTIRVSFKERREATKLGGGNFSDGLRDALRFANEQMDLMNAQPWRVEKLKKRE
jgi:hypothetical protein